jgi:hypothetical protein
VLYVDSFSAVCATYISYMRICMYIYCCTSASEPSCQKATASIGTSQLPVGGQWSFDSDT